MVANESTNPVKQALALTGDGHAVIPEFNASFARGLTLQATVYLDDLRERATIFAAGERPDATAIRLFVAAGTGDLSLEVVDRPDVARTLVATKALAPGRWVHVSAVIDERGLARLVVDGAERARSDNFPLPAAGSRPLGFLGRDLTRPDLTLHGKLAEVRLWSRDLSLDEIEASRGRRLSGDEPELAACWPLDALVDGRLPDRSGHGRSLRPVGAALAPAPDLPLAHAPAPTPALALRGGASIVARNDLPRLGVALTVQAHVRLARPEAGAHLLTLGDGTTSPLLSLFTLRSDGALGLRVAEAGAVLAVIDARRTLAAGAWTHVTVLLEPDRVTLFLDGQQVAAAPLARPTKRPYTWQTLTLGAAGNLKGVDADLAEVRLFTAALTLRQIARSVRRTMLGTEADLAILWRLDEGRGALARNSGKLGNDRGVREASACDGTITGGAWLERSGLTRARAADARTTRALALDGRGGHVVAPGFPRGPGEGYTIEAWVLLRSLTGAAIVELGDPRRPAGPRVALTPLGTTPDLQFIALSGPADAPVVRVLRAPGVLQPGRWTHVAAAVFPSGLVVLVVDGQNVAERPLFTPAEVAADTGDARAGALLGRSGGPTPRHLDGALAEVRLWSRALTPAELRDRRHLRASGHEHRLVRCYHLDEPDGDLVASAAPPPVRGTIAAGGALRESPSLPLWPTDERVGAGVDAACKLMQDPRIVRSGGPPRVEHVTVYEVVLSARTARGTVDAGCTFEVAVDEPVTLRLDRGEGVDLAAAPGRPATIVATTSGKARLTIDASGALRCPLLKVRTVAMPEGQWEIVAPDHQALAVLAHVTGDSLRAGQPEALGRAATRSPLGRELSRDDAEELATTIRALAGAAGQATISTESAAPMSFAAGDDDPAPAVSASLSRGAAARVDRHDAPLGRPILPRRIELPEDPTPSFAAGEPDELLEVTLLAAGPAAPDDDDESPSFGLLDGKGTSRLAGSRRLRDELRRLGDDTERALARAGQRIAGAVDKLAAKADELARDLVRLVKAATLKEAGEGMRDLLGDLRDAFVVTVRALDPSGRVLETIQVVADVGGALIRTVVDSVDAAIAAVDAFFERVGAKVRAVVQFVAQLFRWDDILETADGLLAIQQAALARFPAGLRALRRSWNAVLVRLETMATDGIDVALERLGMAEPPDESPPDERSSFILDKLESNFKGDLFHVDLGDTFGEPLRRIWRALDVAGLLRELRAGLRTIDAREMFSDPKAFVRGGLSALLLLLKGLVQLVVRGVRIAGTLMLELAEAAFALLERLANGRIQIPWLTEFIERTILRGRTLTLLTLISVVAAIPYTLAYKLAHGGDDGPFSGPASFAAPADDRTEARASAALDSLTSDGGTDALASETARHPPAEWNADAAAYINVVGSFLCGLVTATADLLDNDKTPVRAVKLVNAAILAVLAGVSGFPASAEGLSQKLQIGNWVLGVLGSVLALVDGVNGILAVKDSSAEDRAEVLTYISGVYSLITMAVGIAFTCVDHATHHKPLTDEEKRDKKTRDNRTREEAAEWLGMTSGIMGGVVGAIPMVPDNDEAKIMAIKFGVSGGFLVVQLATGLTSASLALVASRDEATTT